MRIAHVLSSGRGGNSGLSLHPSGHRLVSSWCGHSGGVDLWGVDTGRHLQSFTVDVELTDIGAQVASELMPPGSDANLDNWPANLLPVIESSMSAAGDRVAVAAGRALRIYRMSSYQTALIREAALRRHEGSVTRVALDGTGRRALSADAGGRLIVWDLERSAPLHTLSISTVPHTVRFIWNNMLALCGDSNGRIICWELGRGARHLQFQAHVGALVTCAFNEDSGVLVTAGQDKAARMWNLEEGKQIGRDMTHRSAICDVTFAHAGRFVVTAGLDGHVAIWNSTDGDLLDWFFDGAPVYRVAFDPLSGQVLIAGARTIKALAVDWQRLREVDADARSSAVMDISPADHAAMFASPPQRPQPTYAGDPGTAAPVGSIMAARQTGELPIPDRSDLAIERRDRSRSAEASMSRRTSASEGASGPSIPGNGSVPPRPAPVASSPSLADAVANARAREQGNPSRSTSYGIGRATPSDEGQSAAAAFFRSETPASVSRISRLPGDEIRNAEPHRSPSRSVSRDRAPSSASVDETIAPTEAASETPSSPTRKQRLTVLAAVIIAIAIVVRFGVGWHYTQRAWPGDLANEAGVITGEYDAVAADLQGEFDTWAAEQRANIVRYRESGTMTPEAAERAVARIESRIEQRRAELDAARLDAAAIRDAGLDELSERRAAAAGRAANLSALATLLVGMLGGVLVMNRRTVRTKPENGRTPSRR
jgi:WD40 repeat protein